MGRTGYTHPSNTTIVLDSTATGTSYAVSVEQHPWTGLETFKLCTRECVVGLSFVMGEHTKIEFDFELFVTVIIIIGRVTFIINRAFTSLFCYQ